MACKALCIVAALLTAGLTCVGVVILHRTPPPSRRPVPPDAVTACASNPIFKAPSDAKTEHVRRGAEFDIVVHGAAGSVGKLISQYLATSPGNFKFAISSKSYSKLDVLDKELTELVKARGHGREAGGMFILDNLDEESLRKLVRRTAVVLNAAASQRLASELVRICADEGTHYADLGADATWQRRAIDVRHSPAQISGSKIILSAGYTSLPFDLGTNAALELIHQAMVSVPQKRIAITALTTRLWGEEAATGVVPSDTDPYLLTPGVACPSDTVVDGWGPARFDGQLGTVGLPHAVGAANGLVVRRSLELLGHRGITYADALSLRAVAGRFLARWMPESLRMAGQFDLFIMAHEEASGLACRVQLLGHGSPSSWHAAGLLAETGLCLSTPSCHRANSGGGVMTPASAMNTSELIKRLRAASLEDGIPLLKLEVVGCNQSVSAEL